MSIVVAAVAMVVAAISIGVASLGMTWAAAAQAATAADASALAAAVASYPAAGSDPPTAVARDAARHNGARLVSCGCPIDTSMAPRVATVVVAVDIDIPFFGSVEVERTARAEFDPVRWLGLR